MAGGGIHLSIVFRCCSFCIVDSAPSPLSFLQLLPHSSSFCSYSIHHCQPVYCYVLQRYFVPIHLHFVTSPFSFDPGMCVVSNSHLLPKNNVIQAHTCLLLRITAIDCAVSPAVRQIAAIAALVFSFHPNAAFRDSGMCIPLITPKIVHVHT